MVWASRFTAVPTSELAQDGPLDPSAKATREQVQGYMRNVPAVYDQLRRGATEADFEAMRASADPHKREIGDAYHHLFSPSGYDHRIEADYVDGQGLVIQRGRHRVEAARELGIDYLPVHVRAADQQTLNMVAEWAEERVEAISPGTASAQRTLDTAYRDARPELSGNVQRDDGRQSAQRVSTQRPRERSRER
jgi:hypothetical protein